MRRFVFLLFATIALIISGCNSAPSINPQPLPPTQSLATVEPTLAPAPTETSAPIPTLVPPTAVATGEPTIRVEPTVRQSATNVAQAPTNAPTAATSGGVVTFQSQTLGIRFNYLSKQDDVNFAAKEVGDKVYVYMTNTDPTTGQYVQVFPKSPGQSLVDAIKVQVLKGYSLQDCIPITINDPNRGFSEPASYDFAAITLPFGAKDTQEEIQTRAAKCPQPYAAVGGLAYFLADTQHPDKFLFFSIGQYYIPAGNNQPWQTTIQFLNSGSTGTTLPAYLDDRSSATSILQSYVNAVNRKEYARAYSYWEPAAAASQLPPFDQFQQGYANTAAVQLSLGTITVGVGAGNIYSTVPVVMVAQTTSGTTQTYVGCYITHQGQPANFGAPPFQPLAIQQAKMKQVANSAEANAQLATICQNLGFQTGGGVPPQPTFAPGDISAARYLDDRSDPGQVLRSLFNAINRKEYVRAYYYWEPNAPQLPPYRQFAQGYANTASVQLTLGTVIPDAGAGQIYYQVPVTLVAQTTDGVTQTYVGCYILHMSNPGIPMVPPYHPLGIQRGKATLVPNNANTAALMAQACQP